MSSFSPALYDESTSARILIADDDPETRQLSMSLLSPLGRVRTVDSGSAAVQLALEIQPQLIVTELGLPDLDGSVLCATIRSDEELRESVILGVTGEPARVSPALSAGCDAVLMKPWDARNLMLRATSLMLRRSAAAARQRARNESTRIAHLLERSADPASGGTPSWPTDECPHCSSSDVVQFDISADARRPWFVCTNCARAWMGDRIAPPLTDPSWERVATKKRKTTALKQLQLAVRAYQRGRASRRVVVGALTLARTAGVAGEELAFAVAALSDVREEIAPIANRSTSGPVCPRCRVPLVVTARDMALDSDDCVCPACDTTYRHDRRRDVLKYRG